MAETKNQNGGAEEHTISADRKSVVVEARVRETLQRSQNGVNRVDSDFIPALSEKVEEIIQQASQRAKANGRATIRAVDL